MAGTVIEIAAALIENGDGQIFLVRKRGTAAFMQAGGKIHPDETPFAALARELAEELGWAPSPAETQYLGRFSAPAANEPGHRVDAHLFRLRCDGRCLVASAELDEGRWLFPEDALHLDLAPLTREHVLPLAREGGAGRHGRVDGGPAGL